MTTPHESRWVGRMKRMSLCVAGIATAGLSWSAPVTAADAPKASPTPAEQVRPQDAGETLYKTVCQGCHMSEAQGAVGAGRYPALANNPRLQSPYYPLTVVTNGQRAMPRLGAFLTDVQIANVVNYVRTHFGNRYTDLVSAKEVRKVRRPKADLAE
jgi:mono/diheme cytochrome c family protein